MAFELGLYTFGDLMPNAAAANAIGAQQRLQEILEAARLADAAGLDVFAVGEHHRLDMAVSATTVVLAVIAAVTERIRLASAVTILSTADPVVVFEEFATVDLISGGRTEIIAGRGIFTESFPLFGYQPRRLRRSVCGKARAADPAQRRRARHLAGTLSPAPE